MVVIAPTQSHPEMSEIGRVEAELQKEIVIVDNLNTDATTDDQPILDTGDQSETIDYEGFLDLGFMPPVFVHVVPLNVVYHDSYFEVENPQVTNSDTKSDNDQFNTQKRKAFFSRGDRDAKARSSSIDGDPSSPLPSNKRKIIFYLNILAGIWGITVDKVREIMAENNAAIQEKYETRKGDRMSAKLAQVVASAEDSVDVQITNDQVKKIQLFNNIMDIQHKVSDLNNRVRCTKPRNESLKLHLVRKKTEYEYTKVVFARELIKFGYSEWIKIQEIIEKNKGIHPREVKLAIHQLLNKVKKLNLVPSTGPSRPSTST
ncbi:unnamed protein product [Lactuca saligna]|uniref:Uncharacterized protein n=1 Tax=Lactuca saligna TaxID=75948 RepID=A0AA35ZD63_LACSI|nr:unnamed protein product [Lactuca saligna]